MGCTDSKATGTQNQKPNNANQNQNQNQPENKENEAPKDTQADQTKQDGDQGGENTEEVYVTVEEATTYVSHELGISEEKAGKIVQKVNKSEDGKIANKELIALWEKIKAKKDEIKPKFDKYDADNSGTVSADEAYEVLKEIFIDIEEKSVRAMITRFDENNTGRMNFNEFILFYAHICARKEKLQECFNELDKDNTGDLSSEEVCNVLMEECALEKVQALSLVEDFDQNNDGKLNKEEFNTLFVKCF